ncbi:MAG: argininosuccinate synthase [Stygiobacter sp. RIFOXYC12_FULL_38_8]|nr:MAG: argininosuccinate synthase [Stygiobacter sp. RIFOXYA12_FULL_38_9]OGV07840.1 MAG: argininosuccinate synthase [Stygiobacter sp. RIFOXYB2_FULL_37_11]OGV11704.1 MAG: argininosuccinate synthase [Stygiobacter sp. RIFOXYA2_FULL_38_8]OGV12843.1 MAG: argininosuccinate synthase [Stygiobacter sp. RIFOXYC2_FULL_38_25]OGV27100.1 MAG: argininosuccinate synthase [Stygiobacter sp. RIFOXYC12_FULL_38_8]OGV81900.1 MAG: argininosuccinate synthase [Stygiobacter sp. GWF2_38_21]RJQ61347.1 MAG: argininosucci
MAKNKIVVAYSGGLDTSVMVKWLKENYDAEIITFTGNLGQTKELIGLEEKALKSGASKSYIEDLTKEFIDDYVFPALRAGAMYEETYPMACSIGRPLLAKTLVDIARKEGANMVAHGCTGKGNDQVRFEVAVGALAPDLENLAPLRTWEFKSREEEIDYAAKHNIPVLVTKENPYSIDENIWGTAIECGVLEDPMVEPPADAYQHTVSPEEAPDVAEYVTIDFEKGIPVALNGVAMESVALVKELNKIGGRNAIGRIDMIENRLVGIKSREVYEAPAGMILHAAHKELERITLDKAVAHYKTHISQEYANLIYNGLWFSPLREALQAFIDKTQEKVTGMVKMKLYKGNTIVSGRKSPYSLYDPELATYTAADQFDHKASEGFIKIYGLPYKTINRVMQKANATKKDVA